MFINYAHRGASEYMPENTLSAFYLGIFQGANGIETDVKRTKDGVLVLFHDDILDKKTNASGNISDFTYRELLQFDVTGKQPDKSKKDKIPTLEDFLKYFAFRHIAFAVEL
jgi:glycerophosphoryl diester phosphodiesterase